MYDLLTVIHDLIGDIRDERTTALILLERDNLTHLVDSYGDALVPEARALATTAANLATWATS